MRRMEVVGVRVEMPSNSPIVLLKEQQGDRYLPIWIGAVEATAIAFAQQGMVSLRPLTHDLFKDVLEVLNVQLRTVNITALRDGIFYADLDLLQRRGGQRPAVGLDRPGAAHRRRDLRDGRDPRRGRRGHT